MRRISLQEEEVVMGERRTCMRVVTRVENPKPWIIMVPKFEIPPFGMLPGGSQYGVKGVLI
jgi:hypothetical protein